jgi:hypothetical protein
LDGQGGAYQHQLDAPLGKFSRINSNLSFEYDTLSDADNWSVSPGSSGFNISLAASPRRLSISHDGSTTSIQGVSSKILTTPSSLNSFAITFKNLSFTDNDSENGFILGVSDSPAGQAATNGLQHRITDGGFNRVEIVDGGSVIGFGSPSNGPNGIDYSGKIDLTLAVEINNNTTTLKLLQDGKIRAQTSASTPSGSLSPFINLTDDGSNTQSESLEVEQVTVEPIGGTF